MDEQIDEPVTPHASNEKYPYRMQVTGGIHAATLRGGDTLVYDKGYLTYLDDLAVIEVAKKYPGRPGLDPMPRRA
ncbi:MAG: hypothetical protein A2133_04865 [Actinobacteria bacterium RBG_16_64_13]|nr:MAG: hypothetical protein A2133_04865 [Actinobacteria bacterium RBG_16_64_13]